MTGGHRLRAVLVAVPILATAAGVSACSGLDTASAGNSSTAPTTTSGAAPSDSAPSSAAPSGAAPGSGGKHHGGGAGNGGGNGAGSAANGHRKGGKVAKKTVVAWVTDVLEKKYDQACERLSADANKPDDAKCAQTLTHLHDAWAKPGIPVPPQAKVSVGKLSRSNGSVTVPDTSIRVGEHSLHELMMIGATVPKDSTFGLSLVLHKQGTAWQITGVHVGTQSGGQSGGPEHPYDTTTPTPN